MKIAAVIFAGVIMTLFVDTAIFVKGITLSMGIILFGQPLLSRGAYWLNHKYPNWRCILDLKKYASPISTMSNAHWHVVVAQFFLGYPPMHS